MPELILPGPPIGQLQSLVPAGTIVAYAGEIKPFSPNTPDPAPNQNVPILAVAYSGWVLCDGQYLKISDFPQLFAAIGFLYGQQGDDQFRIPDLRGFFLRGAHGELNNVDPDAKKRTPAANGTATGPGSIQGSAIQSHKHKYQMPQSSTPAGDKGTAIATKIAQDSDVPDLDSMSGQTPLQDKVSLDETRPVNIYVNYLIKF